jgi:DNA-binding NarL/FixJ family response regulator
MTLLARTVLIVEDEFVIAEMLSTYIEDLGVPVCGRAATMEEAVALAVQHRPAVILMDVRLIGEKDGVDAALAIYDAVGSRVIFVTGSREPATMERINLDHPYAVLFKPMTEHQLKAIVSQALAD